MSSQAEEKTEDMDDGSNSFISVGDLEYENDIDTIGPDISSHRIGHSEANSRNNNVVTSSVAYEQTWNELPSQEPRKGQPNTPEPSYTKVKRGSSKIGVKLRGKENGADGGKKNYENIEMKRKPKRADGGVEKVYDGVVHQLVSKKNSNASAAAAAAADSTASNTRRGTIASSGGTHDHTIYELVK